MIGQVFPLLLQKLLVFNVFFGLQGVAFLHAWVARPSMVSVVTPFFKSGNVIIPSQRNSVKFSHIGLRASLFDALLDIARQCGSAARSFRNCARARNPDNLLLFRVFGILQISHRVGSFVCFSMLNQKCQETYMMNRLLIRCSACFWTSSVMPCSM